MNFPLPPFPEPSHPESTWTLATYNVQDLFDTLDDPASADERPSENRLRNKMTRLGRLLHRLDADVIGLMEVETLGVLQRLNQEYLNDLGYRNAILIEGNDPERGIDVALLSRFHVTQVVSHTADGEVLPQQGWRRIFSRDCLECHVALPGGETLVVLVNHFKSKRGGIDETQFLRSAQAQRVRAIAQELLGKFPWLAVVGDLNDTPDSVTLHALTQEGLLADVAQDVPEGHRYSFVHAGQPERIDYILASKALHQQMVPNSVFIPHDTWAKRASDHYPLRAAFARSGQRPAGYPQSLTVAYDEQSPPVRRGHVPPRINAARFFPQDIHAFVGQLVVVTGVVQRVEQTQGTGVARVFLGHADPARAFRVTLFPEVRRTFAEAGFSDIAGVYRGKMTQGIGVLQFYQGHPEIAVQTPRQFQIIEQ